MGWVLGVDSSTQSTKVQARDLDTGQVLASGSSPHPVTTPPRSEQPPSAWWTALADAIGQTRRTDPVAISVAGQQHAMVVLGEDGTVLRPAKLWNDTESAPDAAALVDRHGARWWAEAVGSVPVASFTVSKLAWLRRIEPEVFAAVRHVLLPHDWITFGLTGRRVTDRGDASGTGYWSPATDRWRPDILGSIAEHPNQIEWNERLPEVLGPSEGAGTLTAEARASLGLKGAPVVGPGTGDNMAAALGIGLLPGQVAISIGTSGTVFAVSERPVADPNGSVAGFADATGNHLPLVCTLNASKVVDLVAGLLGVSLDELATMALAETSTDGPVLLPYLDGERTPNRPTASGLVAGLRSDSSRQQVAVAAFRGVACSLLDGLDALEAVGVDTGRGPIRLVGGGARSTAHRQFIADLAGRPVVTPDGDEHVAVGAAVQAAAVIGRTSPAAVSEAWGLGRGPVVEPRAVDSAAIRARYVEARDVSSPLDGI